MFKLEDILLRKRSPPAVRNRCKLACSKDLFNRFNLKKPFREEQKMKILPAIFLFFSLGLLLQPLHQARAQIYQPDTFVIEDDHGDQHETAIAADPNNPQHLLVTWNDFRDGGNSKPGYGFSTDGGETWTTTFFNHLGFDPSCVFDKDGYAYYTYIRDNPGSLGGVEIARTNNFGQPWIFNQVSPQTNSQDKPYMTIDNTGGGFDGRIYIAWKERINNPNAQRILFSFSANKGDLFSSPCTLAIERKDPGPATDLTPYSDTSGEIVDPFLQGPVPAVAPNGYVYVVWLDADGGHASTGRIMVRRSTDGGANFDPARVAANITVTWGYQYGTLRAASIPTIAIDQNSGNIYVAYVQIGNGVNDIYFVRSTDQGNSWNTSQIATQNTLEGENFPWLSVGPSGTISLVYYQARETPLSVDVYIAESYNNGLSFYGQDTRITPQSTNPANTATLARSDYIGVISLPGHDVLPVYAEFGNNNADIHLGKYNSATKLAFENKSFSANATAHNSARQLVRSGSYLHETFSSGGEIFYRRSFDKGQSWDVTQKITTDNQVGGNDTPCLTAFRSGSEDWLHLVWQRDIGNNTYQVWYSRSKVNPINWSAPVILPGADQLTMNSYQAGAVPVISPMNGGTTLFAFFCGNGRLLYRTSNNNGVSWSTPSGNPSPPDICAILPHRPGLNICP